MCFSAQASFAAAVALSIISFASIRRVRTEKLIPIALTPLWFGIQQATEGFVWITINNGTTANTLHLVSMYSFLFFAGMFWPTWIPFSLYFAESSHKRKRLLFIFMICGAIVSLLFLWSWLIPATGAVVVNHHINYPVGTTYPLGINSQLWENYIVYILSFLYGCVTIIPFFISSVTHMHLLGMVVGISAAIAYVFYLVAFPSVWCFFAAVCSILIYFIVG
jgi:hypothetical protein